MTRKLARQEIRVWSCYAVLFLTVQGCGEKGPARYELSGTITYRGNPVPAGTITFEPKDIVVNSTTIGEAEIKDGQYRTLPDKGVVGGAHRVFVSGYNGIPEPGSGPLGASIFATYTTEIKLPREPSTHDFKVPANVPAMGSR